MSTQIKQQIERENKSSLLSKLGSIALKTALLPIVGHFPREVQGRILDKGKKYWKGVLPFFATGISIAEELGLGMLVMNEIDEGNTGAYTILLATALIGESMLRGLGYVLFFDNRDMRTNFEGSCFPSLEGYIPGKIVEAGMDLYDKYKSNKQTTK